MNSTKSRAASKVRRDGSSSTPAPKGRATATKDDTAEYRANLARWASYLDRLEALREEIYNDEDAVANNQWNDANEALLEAIDYLTACRPVRPLATKPR